MITDKGENIERLEECPPIEFSSIAEALKYVSQKIDSTKSKRPVLFLLAGESGVGKSCLADSIMRRYTELSKTYGYYDEIQLFEPAEILHINGDRFHAAFVQTFFSKTSALWDTVVYGYTQYYKEEGYIKLLMNDALIIRKTGLYFYLGYYFDQYLAKLLTGKKIILWDQVDSKSYFLEAKKLRPQLDIPVTVFCLTIKRKDNKRIAEVVSWEWGNEAISKDVEEASAIRKRTDI